MSVRLSLAGYAVTGASLVVLLAAACDNGSTSDTAAPTVTATETNIITVTATPTPSASTNSPKATPTPTNAATKSAFAFDKGLAGLRVHNPDGSEYLVQVKLGPIMTHAPVGLKAGKFKLGDACSYNPRTDAAMQYTVLVASNTTVDPAVWNLDIRTSTGRGTFPIVVESFQTNTGNLNCVGGDTPIYQNGGSFSPDGYRQTYGMIIIPGYKTATHPKAKLANSPLRFEVTGTVLTRQDFGSKQSNGYYPLPLG